MVLISLEGLKSQDQPNSDSKINIEELGGRIQKESRVLVLTRRSGNGTFDVNMFLASGKPILVNDGTGLVFEVTSGANVASRRYSYGEGSRSETPILIGPSFQLDYFGEKRPIKRWIKEAGLPCREFLPGPNWFAYEKYDFTKDGEALCYSPTHLFVGDADQGAIALGKVLFSNIANGSERDSYSDYRSVSQFYRVGSVSEEDDAERISSAS